MTRFDGVTNRILRLCRWITARRWILPVLIFTLALLPRLVGLNDFLTADEDDQLRFAGQFLQAILSRDWAGMLVLGYPGVPTLALGALGLAARYGLTAVTSALSVATSPVPTPAPALEAAYTHRVFLPVIARAPEVSGLNAMLAAIPRHPLDFIVWVRLPMVLTASAAIVLIFLLLRKLLPEKTAVLATLLLAFDPFFLANSRIIHVDAPLTYFMFAAFLAFLVYLKDGRWQILLLSGVLGGLAALSKTPAFILAPILVAGGGLFVWRHPRRSPALTKRWVLALVGWGIILLVAFVLFWPSMWTKPMFAITWIFRNALGAVNAPHPSRGLFWGAFITDRSPWYYTVALPFLLTPLTTIGLFFGGMAALRGLKRPSRTVSFALALLAFALIFLAVVSIPARRGIRYTLPIFPALAVLAALGLTWLAARIRWGKILLTVAVFAQVGQVLLFSPYYFNYTNPLLGGGRTAPKFVVLGWGEGLDRAAAYLNQQPDAAQKTVAAWYSWQFAHYFDGRTVDLAGNEPAYTADYTVFYINQIQRRFPSEELLDYFADRQPEKIIKLGGIDYAWIYPGPIIGRRVPEGILQPLAHPLNEALILQGMDIAPPRDGAIPVTLFWQTMDALPPDMNVSLRLVDAAGEVWGQVDRLPIGGLVRTQAWQPGDVIRDEYMLRFDPATPPGTYYFDVQMYDFTTGDVFGAVNQVGQVTISVPEKVVSVTAFEAWLVREQRAAISEKPVVLADGLTLMGDTFRDFETLPGYRTTFKMYWRAEKIPPTAPLVSLVARDADGAEIPLADVPIGRKNYPADQWRRGELLGQTVTVRFPAEMLPGEYTLLATADDAVATLGTVTVRAQAHIFDLPADARPTDARFGDAIALAGYTITPAEGAVEVSLFWRTDRSLDDDLKVFVHITDAAGNIIAQRDHIPADGTRPTLTWVGDEIITDSYLIPLENTPFAVWVGLYNPLTGERLPVDGGGLPVSENRLQLRMTNDK